MRNALSLAHAENMLAEKLDTLFKNLQGHLVQKFDLLVAIRNKQLIVSVLLFLVFTGFDKHVVARGRVQALFCRFVLLVCANYDVSLRISFLRRVCLLGFQS